MTILEKLTLWLGHNLFISLASALTVVAAMFAIVGVLRRVVRRQMRVATAEELSPLARILARLLSRTQWFLVVFVSVWAGMTAGNWPPRAQNAVNTATTLALLLQAGLWLSIVLDEFINRRRQALASIDRAALSTLGALGFMLRVALWAVLALLALDNLGVDITALVAGLGIGGIAVALALQNVLGDLFASLSIAFDRPFVMGDFLVIDEQMGTVESIGVKSTRLRSLSGEQLIFSNADLLGSRVRNFGRMRERRVAFTVGVTYDTPIGKLEILPTLLRQAVEAQPAARFDRAHFKAHGDFALTFETVYYVEHADYNVYMNTQEQINLAIHRAFKREQIEFAYPTQTLLLRTVASEPAQ